LQSAGSSVAGVCSAAAVGFLNAMTDEKCGRQEKNEKDEKK
jgi:hypothetical protein